MFPSRVYFFAVAAALSGSFLAGCKAKDHDPRTKAPLVLISEVPPAQPASQIFTGVVAARVQAPLGFRVGGKIIARYVDRGQIVHRGDLLMKLDPADFETAVNVQSAAVEADEANLREADIDAQRYAKIVDSGAVSRQVYTTAANAADSARAALAGAQAQLKIARDNLTYTDLIADQDGTVVDTAGEPGQVVAAGEAVLDLALSGPREAVVDLPETLRPHIGDTATAKLYGDGQPESAAILRELSDSSDPATRTFTARFVLQGLDAAAPIGATVSVNISESMQAGEAMVPISALFDNGTGPGVWVYDRKDETVSLAAVTVQHVGAESAIVTGVQPGVWIAALGADLLHEGEVVRASRLAAQP
jgi:RND family efflux transporter MFP subunit